MEKQVNTLVSSIKARRIYIYKLFKLVGSGQVNLMFLQKEINKEFDMIGKLTKQLLQGLSDLYCAREITLAVREVQCKIDLELEEILNACR